MKKRTAPFMMRCPRCGVVGENSAPDNMRNETALCPVCACDGYRSAAVPSAPKERPILFSAPMVRALLDGRKSQTRRIAKGLAGESPNVWDAKSPYGVPGDRLWVKETHSFESWDERGHADVTYEADGGRSRDVFVDVRDFDDWSDRRATQWRRAGAELLKYHEEVGDNVDATDDDDGEDCWLQMPSGKKPPISVSIHMPRWASRILLDVTDVRVERLQDISKGDAIAEGLTSRSKDGVTIKFGIPDRDGLWGTDDDGWPWADWNSDPRIAYRTLWERINGAGSWALNPWTWVVGFKVVEVRR